MPRVENLDAGLIVKGVEQPLVAGPFANDSVVG